MTFWKNKKDVETPPDSTKPEQPTPPAMPDDGKYPKGLRLYATLVPAYTALFLVALDRLIVSTATAQITNTFDSAGDIGWYGTAYMMANCAFQLQFGRLFGLVGAGGIKALFLAVIAIFEIGSVVCGAAPSSAALIVGRAIAGLGAGGITAGMMTVLVHSVPLHRRPKYQSLVGVMFAVASIAGPVVGGALTTNVTWRWCFYINLPIGGAAAAMMVLWLRIDPALMVKRPGTGAANANANGDSSRGRWWALLQRVDVLGTVLLLGSIVCLCLALQWGGSMTYAWGSGRVAGLLATAGVLAAAFAAAQALRPEHQVTLPPRVLRQRSVAAGFASACCAGAHMSLLSFFVPVWFQAVLGVSAVASGVRTLPMLLPIVVGGLVTGVLAGGLGYYTPFLLLGSSLAAVGAGLLTTLHVDVTDAVATGRATSAAAPWASFQVLYGLGLGLSSQVPNVAAQTVLPRPDVPLGASLMFFGQQLFGAIFVTVGQAVLDQQLGRRLAALPGSGITSAHQVAQAGTTDVLGLVPAALRPAALLAYNASVRMVLVVGLVMACVGVLGGFAMEWRTVKKRTGGEKGGEAGAKTGKVEETKGV